MYSPGYDKSKDVISQSLISDACHVAKSCDAVLLFIGLTEDYESEGYDRKHLRLPVSHTRLLKEIKAVNENVIVVLSGGAPVIMPWLKDVKAVLNAYLAGQAFGESVADLLTGEVNPSGKLAETYPLMIEDTPCFENFPGNQATVEYRESVYVGYRYYETAKKDVLFPFGFGLSYTEFEYSGLKLSKKKIKDTDTLKVSFTVKNVGDRAGAEVSQLYVSDCESTIYRPEKELRAFAKTYLEPGEEKKVELELDKRAFAYYNVNISDWHVESGRFDILVGANVSDIKLKAAVTVESTQDAAVPDYRQTAPELYAADVHNVSDAAFEAVLGFAIPAKEHDKSEKLTILNCLADASHTKWGGRINSLIDKAFALAFKADDPNGGFVKAMALEIPIRNFVTMSDGVFTDEMAKGLLMILNDEGAAKGMGKIIAGLAVGIKNLPALLKAI